MITYEPGELGADRAPPETLPADHALTDPAIIGELVDTARADAQQLRLIRPARLGADPATDAALLGLLTEAAGQMVHLHWVLDGEQPWPLRTVVHLPPPAAAAENSAFVTRWQRSHRLGQCTYRRGPDFVLIRDVRPEGPHRRVLIEAEWAHAFTTLLDGRPPAEPSTKNLLDGLIAADLAIPLAATIHHILPIRLHKWPIPYNDV
uniref:DUF5825 family protein n=1 Tax=Actinomadura sp. CA-154981 TaxID=3240037 RepID=UPI003F491148